MSTVGSDKYEGGNSTTGDPGGLVYDPTIYGTLTVTEAINCPAFTTSSNVFSADYAEITNLSVIPTWITSDASLYQPLLIHADTPSQATDLFAHNSFFYGLPDVLTASFAVCRADAYPQNAVIINSDPNINLTKYDEVAEYFYSLVLSMDGITSNKDFSINKNFGVITLGDLNGATRFELDVSNATCALNAPSSIDVYSSSIRLDSTGSVGLGDTNNNNNNTKIDIIDTDGKITLQANSGVHLNAISTIRYSATIHTTNQTLGLTSKYSNTFNATNLTTTLPVVSSSTVGVSFLITNINSSALTVNSSSSQNIYASTGVASSTSRSLNQGHARIFTAIQIGASTYGWAMV